LARSLKRGTIVPDETLLAAKIAFDPPLLPRALVPFVESPDFALLADALRTHRMLYSHPAVCEQIAHLLRLRQDDREWERLGWSMEMDNDGCVATPHEVERVDEVLHTLLAAHLEAMLPDMELEPRRVRTPPGRAAGIRNRHRVDESTKWVASRTLYESWRALHERLDQPIAQRLLVRQPKPLTAEHIERVVALLRDAIADDPPMWSALVEWRYEELPPATLSEDERELWAYAHTATPCATIDLAPVVTDALKDLHKRKLKVSAAAYLASAVLAAHLGTTPTKVHSRIEHYLRTHDK